MPKKRTEEVPDQDQEFSAGGVSRSSRPSRSKRSRPARKRRNRRKSETTGGIHLRCNKKSNW